MATIIVRKEANNKFSVEKGLDSFPPYSPRSVLRTLSYIAKEGDIVIFPYKSIGPNTTATTPAHTYCIMSLQGEVLQTSDDFFDLLFGSLRDMFNI